MGQIVVNTPSFSSIKWYVLIALIFFGFGYIIGNDMVSLPGKSASEKPSKHIIALTQPKYSIEGKVSKVDGQTFWLTYTPQDATLVPQESDEMTDITYKIVVSDTTTISGGEISAQYIDPNKKQTIARTPSVSDIIVGQRLSVSTEEDLRTIQGSEFTAQSITLPRVPNFLSGQIIGNNGNTLLVKSQITDPSSPQATTQEVTYSVLVVDATEISGYSQDKDGQRETYYKVADLVEGTQISVYADTDVYKAQQVTALRIEPQFPQEAVEPADEPIPQPTKPPQPSPSTNDVDDTQ